MKASKMSYLDELNEIMTVMVEKGDNLDFVNSLKKRLETSTNIFKTEIKSSEDIDITKQVIGRKGYYLYLTTEKTGVYLIWHNHSKKTYSIWSPSEEAMNKAVGVINHRIYITRNRKYASSFSI